MIIILVLPLPVKDWALSLCQTVGSPIHMHGHGVFKKCFIIFCYKIHVTGLINGSNSYSLWTGKYTQRPERENVLGL